jgi:hypothetical protein
MKKVNWLIIICVAIIVALLVVYKYTTRTIAITPKIAKNATYDIRNYVDQRNEAYPVKLTNGTGISNNDHPISLTDKNIFIEDVNHDTIDDALVGVDINVGYNGKDSIVRDVFVVTGTRGTVKTSECNPDYNSDCAKLYNLR